ncbi:28S ribosomal protein S35, mitochondrial isoform X1 [Ischnura elegans]|uniref:28S ribosomal protein S35, mitochondrial isoform X1 n=1 Tax=Ischnura elegans TaxID=197161 RepID=UPI001ED88E45|nr:28S ribosomal protein S35, mitochondrial isoform X1 [Ischnura elegans]
MVFKASSGIAILHNCKYLFALPPPVRQASHAVGQEVDTDEFRVLDLKLKKKTQTVRRTQRKLTALSPRSEKMHVDQHWPSVWPGPRTFHPATVPLPLHQGYPHKKKSTPGKFANTELMKIPNFLHLTPPAIKQQCEALKKFCTDWPKGLETDEQQESHRPIEVSTSTYCHSSPSIRDPLSRIVTVKVHVRSLPLNAHAKDKFLRLVGERYDPTTDVVTLVADRCPLQNQNRDYAFYLLTALFHESWKVEPWESEKLREDMEVYLWEGSESEQNFSNLLQWKGKNDKENPKSNISKEDKENYKIAVESLFNSGEDAVTINKYKEATKNLVCLVLK